MVLDTEADYEFNSPTALTVYGFREVHKSPANCGKNPNIEPKQTNPHYRSYYDYSILVYSTILYSIPLYCTIHRNPVLINQAVLQRPRAARFRSKRIRRCMGVFALRRRRKFVFCLSHGRQRSERLNPKPYMRKVKPKSN